jgi:Zn-dependent protease
MMNRSFQLAVIAGIPIRIHWSFFILVMFVLYVGSKENLGFKGTLWFAAAMLSLFFCVLLHEYGHALTAKRFGIKTRDIILSPIGGMARLEKLPEKPIHEFYVALAGPAVNIFIAFILGLLIVIFFSASFSLPSMRPELIFNSQGYLKVIFWMNIALFGFNLVPAFPMDGGRILRSLLAIRMGKTKSTKIAAMVGRILAVVAILAGLIIPQLFLSFIGVFVYFMASQEARAARIEEALEAYKISSVYKKDFEKITPDDSMELLIDSVYRSSAKNFLVFENESIIGCVPELMVWDAIKTKKKAGLVKDRMSDKFSFISQEKTVLEAYRMMNEGGYGILAIQENDQILGYIDRNIIQNLVDSSSF